MKGIKFGDFHSYRDFRLILKPKEIGSPEVKVRKIDIEGADSSLDYTDFFGEPKYEDVIHKFEFSFKAPQDDLLYQYSQIKNAIHGKKMRIILDDDPLYYYLGRVSVSSLTTERGIGLLRIECDCEPWKYHLQETVSIINIDGTSTFDFHNEKKRVVPQIKTTAAMNISYGGNSWAVGVGTFTIPELEFVEGYNYVTITGTGQITFTYREASL